MVSFFERVLSILRVSAQFSPFDNLVAQLVGLGEQALACILLLVVFAYCIPRHSSRFARSDESKRTKMASVTLALFV
jgi:hypothetical protein